MSSCISIGPRIEEDEPGQCQGAPRAVSSAGFVFVADRLGLMLKAWDSPTLILQSVAPLYAWILSTRKNPGHIWEIAV
jgi:hypothetical protein